MSDHAAELELWRKIRDAVYFSATSYDPITHLAAGRAADAVMRLVREGRLG